MTTHARQKSDNLNLASNIVSFRQPRHRNWHSYLPIIVLIVAAAFFVQDIYVDLYVDGKGISHVVVEGSIFLAILLALVIELKQVARLVSKIDNTEQEVIQLQAHLSEVIDNEFRRWSLTNTEKEIAILLIKGFSMQEIAGIRGVKEKSVRQQATGVYAKAGVSGRYELTSHFIEDLLAPPGG